MILLHAASRAMLNGLTNPKNYPYWPALLAALEDAGAIRLDEVVQVGLEGDPSFVADFRAGLALRDLRGLVAEADWWLSIDSFLPHLAQHLNRPGVVFWAKSDPAIFGYPENLNLLRSCQHLRARQFRIWEEESFDPEAFLPVDAAVDAILTWRHDAIAPFEVPVPASVRV